MLPRNDSREPDTVEQPFTVWSAEGLLIGVPIGIVMLIVGGALRAHVDGFNFSIFDAVPPLRLIDEHRATPWHVARFGGGLPPRPPILSPPPALAGSEQQYVRELLRAYEDRLGTPIRSLSDLAAAGGRFSPPVRISGLPLRRRYIHQCHRQGQRHL